MNTLVTRPRFFGPAALALSAFIVAAFARTYYLRFLGDLPPLGVLLHLHGAVFTAWLVVFIVQTRLVARRRIDMPRKLGIASVGLAVLVVLAAVRIPLRPTGLTGAQFTIVPLTTIALFAAFVSLGIVFRKRAALHKRFMVLAMIAVLSPATSRLIALFGVREYSMMIQLIVPALFVAWCLFADWRAGRGVHAVYVIGGAVIVASWPIRQMIAKTAPWQTVGEWIVRSAS